MRHSLSDTSFNSQGLVPSSLLFCNYIALQHICILAHAHTHTRTNAHTLADKHSNIYSILHLLTDIHAPAHMHKHTPHSLIKSSVSYMRDRDRDGVKGGLPNKVKNIRDKNNSSTHCSIAAFSFPACHSSALLVNSLFVCMCVLHVAKKKASGPGGIQATALF